MFMRYARQMRLAIQEGGSTDPKFNTQLRQIIDQALKNKMPNSTIQNVIKKYSDPNQTKLIKFVQDYKALGKVHMVAVFLTENVAGTKQNLQPIMKKFPGAGVTDCRSLFDERGIVQATAPEKMNSLEETSLEEACTEDAIECGAEEIEIADFESKIVNFMCNPVEIERFKRELTQKGYSIDFAGIVFIPKQTITLSPSEIETMERLKAKMKEIEGVEEIFDNVEYPEKSA
uniref:CSON004979 protein n=1 Tax=Culicoides sonorensis TaxID=179676 RepID=A0A336LY41_CULSO